MSTTSTFGVEVLASLAVTLAITLCITAFHAVKHLRGRRARPRLVVDELTERAAAARAREPLP